MVDWSAIKHFGPQEFSNPELLRPELLSMLDAFREKYGRPILITSSFRDPAHNAAVGGVPDSSHCPGSDGLYSGIDFTVGNGTFTGQELFDAVVALLAAGFKRIGLYADAKHIHVDCESRLAQKVIWIK